MKFSSSSIIFLLIGGGGSCGFLPSAMAMATSPPLETNKRTKNDLTEEVVGTDLLGFVSSGGGGGAGIVATSTLENYDFAPLKGQVRDPSVFDIILCTVLRREDVILVLVSSVFLLFFQLKNRCPTHSSSFI
jgi:hypothetical protein